MKPIIILAATAAILSSCSPEGNERFASTIASMTPDQKIRILLGSGQGTDNDDPNSLMIASAKNKVPGSASATYPVEELGIPALIYADGPAGLRIAPLRSGTDDTFFCTGFPIGTSLAASWDSELVYKVGEAMGNEVLEYGVDVLLAPGINLMRNPLCGRNFEYYSEDPLLSGLTAAAYIKGIQSNGVGACVKHFAVNNQEVNRCSIDERVDRRTLRELYLRNFEIAIKEGNPWTVMTSYNYINAQHASQSYDLTQKVLRDDWGYDGMVMTDWGAGVIPWKQVWSGNDQIMPARKVTFEMLKKSLEEGELSWDDVERNVARVLALIQKTPKARGYEYSNAPDLKSNAAVAREAGAQGCVLLKNNGALPIASGCRVALFGVGSYETIPGGLGAGDVNKAYVINVDDAMEEAGLTLEKSVRDAYRKYMASEDERLKEVDKARGWWYGTQLKTEMDRSVTSVLSEGAVSGSDVAVVTISRRSGEGTDRCMEGDYLLASEEKNLLGDVCEAFHAAGKKVVVVLNVCGPVNMADWESLPDAILVSWLPGQEAGRCIADVLEGKVNPSGKLPMSWALAYEDIPSAANFANLSLPYDGKNHSFYHYSDHPIYEIKDVDYQDYKEGLDVGYRYFATQNVPVSYPFGFGLSYTTFEFSGFEVRSRGEDVFVKVTVTNTGSFQGSQVAQIYWGNSSIEGNPVRQLLCYAKTGVLAPGESQTLEMKASRNDMSWFCTSESSWISEKGEHTVELCSDACTPIASKTVSFRKRLVRPVSEAL